MPSRMAGLRASGGERHGGEAAFPHEELVGVFGRLAFGDVDADELAELR